MAITNEAAYTFLCNSPRERLRYSKTALTTVSARTYSSWLQAGFPAAGVAPTTAVVPDNTTTGALTVAQINPGGTLRILKLLAEFGLTAGGGMVTLCDRLSHQGGLSGTTTTAQTTNLPTAALTRYTTGIGVEAALEIYSAVGATATTTTMSYTNTVPTAGQASVATTFGGTGFNAASRFIPQALASGDKGVTAVASVTVLASTLTAGNFGVTLFYPMFSVPIDHMLPLPDEAEALYGMGCTFPQVFNSACLQFVYHTNGVTTGLHQGTLNLAEDY